MSFSISHNPVTMTVTVVVTCDNHTLTLGSDKKRKEKK